MMDIPIDFDLHRTLLELEPDRWKTEDLCPLHMQIARRLGGKPLRRLAPAELHVLIAENIGLPFLVPLAMERLRDEPFLDACRYPGDLLTAVLEADSTFWLERYDLWLLMIEILEKAVGLINDRIREEHRDEYLPWHLGDDLMTAILHFRSLHRV